MQKFDIPDTLGRRPITIDRQNHNLLISYDKQIVSGDVPRANIYTFEVNPYEILEFAHVFRRDELPSLTSGGDENFQRPLIPTKISSIRNNLLTDPDFMFPNSILAVLSDNCSFDERTASLSIPQTYESISIIDGQHRLFSYANDSVRERMGNGCRIIITAIQFEGVNIDQIHHYSAKAFVEINRNQTGIQKNHLYAIAYDLLGETDNRALAAKILFEANKRRDQSLSGLIETNKRLTGRLKAITIIAVLAPITSVKAIQSLVSVREDSVNYPKKQGYQNLFGVEDIEDISDAEAIVRQGVVCLERYFNYVRSIFRNDWPNSRYPRNSSLEYTKVIAGFVRLLGLFIMEGASWDVVRGDLEAIRDNILELREIRDCDYDGVLFDPSHPAIPDSNPRYTEIFRFLDENRQSPTSIETILEERH